MSGREDSSRSTLLLGLGGLAFVTITAGTGLMQAYYAGLGVLSTNGTRTGLNNGVYQTVAKQANILFPLGQFLLIVGLAIIFAIFVVQMFFSVKGWVKQRSLAPIIAVIVVIAGFAIWDSSRGFSTYSSLYADFAIHNHMIPIFLVVSACCGVALYEDGKTRRGIR